MAYKEVTVDLISYEELIVKSEYFAILVDCLYDGARLNYNEKELVFDSESLGVILRTIDHSAYMSKLNELKELKEKEKINE